MVNLDDPNMWGQHCEQCATLLKKGHAYTNGEFGHHIKIHHNVPPSMEVDINLRFRGLNLEIMFIYSKQHLFRLIIPCSKNHPTMVRSIHANLI